MMKICKFSTIMMMSLCLMATSCLDDKDSYSSGFTVLSTKSQVLYANSTADSLFVFSYGPWKLQPQAGSEWCSVGITEGMGGALYSIALSLDQNTTGEVRRAPFYIYDTDHTETNVSFQLKQSATRGDGSLGSAALVRSVESTDGYVATIDYDQKARPVSYTLTGNGINDRLTVAYNDAASLMTVTYNGHAMSGDTDNGYQPTHLEGATDTVAYQAQYYPNGIPVASNYAFNFVSRTASRGLQAYSYLLSSARHPDGQSLGVDSLHVADSIRYVRQKSNEDVRLVEMLAPTYSQQDNRCQSIDVNQLLLGFAECHPMQLLSLFRYTRSTSIVAEAKSANGDIRVTTTLNSDKSVSTMTVERNGQSVTYTFNY
ncbi:MAG: hypothetical protein IJ544_01495 [Prevotella sp.]|nr:hypothetical protein [Prevotella sp.]